MAGARAEGGNCMRHQWPDGEKRVDLARGIGAHVTMALLGPLAQLTHIAQHQNGAPGETGEHVDGGAD